MGDIKISLGDRWLILGTTGTGKTTFAKQLLKRLHAMYGADTVPMYVLDSKQAGDFARWGGIQQGEIPPAPINKGVMVWQPGTDNQDAYDQWFGSILHHPAPSLLLIDEISSLSSGRSSASPPNFQRLLKQGRGLHKCVISCTQEVAYVPRQITTQTTHVVRFRLIGNYDRQAGNRLMNRDPKDREPTAPYGFFYSRTDKPGVTEYRTYNDFF